MRKLVLAIILSAALTGNAAAETITATVNGLVCSFCATGIEKTFRKQPAVDSVKVDLETKLVTITTKPDQTLDDATVTKLLTDSGYSIVSILRQP